MGRDEMGIFTLILPFGGVHARLRGWETSSPGEEAEKGMCPFNIQGGGQRRKL